MKSSWIVFVGALVSSAAGLLACTGDDNVAPGAEAGVDSAVTPEDGGSDSSTVDSSTSSDSGAADSSSSTEASPGTDGGDAAAPLTRLLLSFNGSNSSVLAAFGLQSGQTDGFLTYPDFIGTTSITPAAPWVLEQSTDVVGRLDPYHPWVVQSSWSVALDDYAPDAGFSSSYADPLAVVAAGAKAYVLRYTRNLVAVLDPSQIADGGAQPSTIDLSSSVQPAGDGYVEMSAGYYDPTSQRLYVLLANIDRFDVASDGYTQLCSATHPTLVAIDTTHDTLVSLGDGGTSGYALPGYGAAFGAATMVYDAPNDRLLVLETGCNVGETDGGVGPMVGRGIVAVSLADGSAQTVLDLTADAYPSGLYYVDAHHAFIYLDTAYAWDPTTSTLGAPVANAPEAFDVDKQGNLVGITQATASDGGPGDWLVVSVNTTDGGVVTLGTNPFPSDSGVGPGYLSGAQLWPAQ
jgi:hypothetical protein